MVNTEIRLIIVFVAEDGETLYTQQKQKLSKNKSSAKPGADCGSYHELLIANFRLK